MFFWTQNEMMFLHSIYKLFLTSKILCWAVAVHLFMCLPLLIPNWEPHSGPSTWECLTLITGFYSCMLNEWLGRRTIALVCECVVLLAKKLPGRSVITSCVFIQTITLAINSPYPWILSCLHSWLFCKWTADAVPLNCYFPTYFSWYILMGPKDVLDVSQWPFFLVLLLAIFDQQCGNVSGNVREEVGQHRYRWVAPGLVRVTIKLSQQRAG